MVLNNLLTPRRHMFGSGVFESWLTILLGALIFAMLFSIVGMMSDFVLDGEMHFTNKSAALGALAFVGYMGVATFLRIQKPSE